MVYTSLPLDAPPEVVPTAVAPLRVLICDDQGDVRDALVLMLKGAGHVAKTAGSPEALLEVVRTSTFDLLLVDLNYTRDTSSGKEGLDLLAELDRRGHRVPVIVMTAWSSVGLAVEAMQRGACDFIEKPWSNDRALGLIEKHGRRANARDGNPSEGLVEAAAAVQQRLLPSAPYRLATLETAGRTDAALGVGGDSFDFLDAGHGRMGVLLSDVSGKGMAAALLMANLQGCLRSRRPQELREPAQLIASVNRQFHAATSAERFATLFYGVYDDATRRLRYVNCGHCPPLLVRSSGEVRWLGPTGTVVGAFAKWTGTEDEVKLAPGDQLVLYSDGVTEAMSSAGQEFGEQRLLNAVRGNFPASLLADEIVSQVSRFSEGLRADDITVVVLEGH